MPLHGRRLRFATEFLKDQNATQAAIRAGFSPASARQQASRMLQDPRVKAAIHDVEARIVDKVVTERAATLDRTIREIARIAFFDPRRLFTEDGRPLAVTELDDDTAAVVAGLDVAEEWAGSGDERQLAATIRKWKLSDKKGALDMLMKHLGGYAVDNEQKQSAPSADVNPVDIARRVAFLLQRGVTHLELVKTGT